MVMNLNSVGIICEYNPFHNGHIYHLEKVKELFPDATIILCLNGYFLERGEISILSKEMKTKIALEYGVDIVIELPFLYGTQSADHFSDAAILLLHSLGVIHLVFGSETNDISYLENLAKKQLEEGFSLSFSTLNYPARLNQALGEENIISPNDLLGISYIKTILKYHYPISYTLIARTSGYHDTTSCSSIISASNIRFKLKKKENVLSYLPLLSYHSIQTIDYSKFFSLLQAKILTDSHLDEYLDVTEGLHHKLKKEILQAKNYEDFLNALKSKRYTYNRIQRMLLHVLFGVLKKDASTPITYVRILGFNSRGQKYLNQNRKKFLLPTTISFSSKIYHYELLASFFYDFFTNDHSMSFEKRNQPIVINSSESNQK